MPLTITPNAAGWLALAEAEHERAHGAARPELWSEVTAAWDRLERPPSRGVLPLGGGPRHSSPSAPPAQRPCVPLRQAYAVAARIGAHPLLRRPRPARPTLAARPGPTAEPEPPDAPRGSSRDDSRPDTARGRGSHARRPRLHEPRDRLHARHQHQDSQRPRLAHPAKTRMCRTGSRPPRSPTASPRPRSPSPSRTSRRPAATLIGDPRPGRCIPPTKTRPTAKSGPARPTPATFTAIFG